MLFAGEGIPGGEKKENANGHRSATTSDPRN